MQRDYIRAEEALALTFALRKYKRIANNIFSLMPRARERIIHTHTHTPLAVAKLSAGESGLSEAIKLYSLAQSTLSLCDKRKIAS